MRTRTPMTYEDIVKLQEIVMEPDSQYERTNYQNMLFSYCWQAIDYVDMMTEHGLKADFTMETLPRIIPAIKFMIEDADKIEGDDPIERLAGVKELLAGYLMFSLYNIYSMAGNRVQYKMNDYETGMSLIIHNYKSGSSKVIDIMTCLDWAFSEIEILDPDEVYEEGEDDEEDEEALRFGMSIHIESFIKALLDA